MKRRNVSSIKPRSEIAFAPSTYWMRMKLHEAAGETTAAWTGFGSSGAVSGSLTIAGTTTNVFDEFGEFKSAGDNGSTITTALHTLFNEIMRTDNLNNGSIIALGNVSSNTTTADSYIFAFNNPSNATNGNGYGLKLLTASKKLQFYAFLGGATLLSTTALDTSNTPVSFGVLLQGDTTINLELAVNGVSEATTTTTTLSGAAVYSCIFGRSGNTGTPADSINTNGRVSELLFIRSTSDLSSDFVEIASEYRDSKGDLTWSMDGK